MAEKQINTRIQLRYDDYENWIGIGASIVLKKGEVAICAVPNEQTAVDGELTRPQVLMKVGDGISTFAQLKWTSAVAADVHAWAKKSESEFTNWVKGLIDVSDIDLSNYYTKAEVDSKVEVNTNAINEIKNGTSINNFAGVEGALANKASQMALNSEIERAKAAEGVNADAIAAEVERAKTAEKKNADAITLLTNGASPDEIDSVNDLIKYVNEHGTEVTAMKSDITANTGAIATEVARAKKAEGDLSNRIIPLEEAKHSHANKSVLDSITSSKVNAWDASENNAKEYADSLSSNYATAAQGKKADSAVQQISTTVNGGLKVTGKNQIDIDTAITFVFNCGSATELV